MKGKLRKSIGILLSVLMVATMIPILPVAAASTNPFQDVKATDWFAESVEYVYDNGLMNGTSATTFEPQTTMSRAMIVTVLHRIEKEAQAAPAQFKDVPAQTWFTNAVSWAAAEGIVNGYSADIFGPADDVTREQIATILYRYAQKKGYDVTKRADLKGYSDSKAISNWASEALEWANAEELIKGYPDKTIGPSGNATRAEVATILMRFCEKFGEKGETVKPPAEKTHTVTFDYNYDNKGVYKTVEVKEGNPIGAIEQPERSGYNFEGWFTEKEKGEKFDSDKAVSGDLTLYAHWTRNSSDGGGSNVVKEEIGVYKVTFDTDGGDIITSQEVKKGESATIPDEPTKENYEFLGWYPEKSYSPKFDFSTPINQDTTIYAKWYDPDDTLDSDNDGLPDSFEATYGSDPTKVDSDNDGITDFDEWNWLNTNPLLDDTDGNGIMDQDEDPDKDGLVNIEENRNGTNMIDRDTDHDGLSDGDEVTIYHTSPLMEDTDGDSVNDLVEIQIGSDPLVAEDTFISNAQCGSNETESVWASATVYSKAQSAGTLEINASNSSNNPLLSNSIPGILGNAYDFSVDGSFDSALISMSYDPSLGDIGDDFQPRIYYLNEEDGTLEELPDQKIENGKVTVEVTHFSTYILLNKVAFDAVWNTEIRPPLSEGGNGEASTIDIVFVIDKSSSMDWNDPNGLAKKLSKEFIDKLRDDKDNGAVIEFASSANILSNLTPKKDLLKSAIDRISYDGGWTNGSDGINAALNTLNSLNSTYKYIVFLTDGQDNVHSYDYNSLANRANENNIIIYSIGMGSANQSILQNIADKTGGKYYHATTSNTSSSSDILQLEDVFEDVGSETVDLITDSNNDGISDYYTDLINKGKLRLANGTSPFAGAVDMYGTDNADWDNDGLKNGEEIKVVTKNDKTYIQMISNPLLKDSDHDGYMDITEVNEKTSALSPLIFNKPAAGLRYLMGTEKDQDPFWYVEFADDQANAKIGRLADWEKVDSSTGLIINYFADYASQDSLDKNAEAIAKQKKWEKIIDVMDTVADTVSLIKNVEDGIAEAGSDKELVKSELNNINTSRKKALDSINSSEDSDENLGDIQDVLSVTKDVLGVIKNICEIGDSIPNYWKEDCDLWETYKTTVKVGNGVASIVGNLIGIATTVNDTFQMPCGKSLSQWATKYQTLMGKPFGPLDKVTIGTGITVGMDLVSGGIEVAEIANTYGKMQANSDAYLEYISVLTNMKKNGRQDYVKTAASTVAESVLDSSWDTYYQYLNGRIGKSMAFTAFKAAFAIVADICPYVKAAQIVFAVVKVGAWITGLPQKAQAVVVSTVFADISDGCIAELKKVSEIWTPEYVPVASDVITYKTSVDEADKYIIQLAQSRIVGLENFKTYANSKHWITWIQRKMAGVSANDIDDVIQKFCSRCYMVEHSKGLNVKLSSKLPYYSSLSYTLR